jgi:hypothetical protein
VLREHIKQEKEWCGVIALILLLSYTLMNFQVENPLLTKLKQTIIQKEEENKFKQVRTA